MERLMRGIGWAMVAFGVAVFVKSVVEWPRLPSGNLPTETWVATIVLSAGAGLLGASRRA